MQAAATALPTPCKYMPTFLRAWGSLRHEVRMEAHGSKCLPDTPTLEEPSPHPTTSTSRHDIIIHESMHNRQPIINPGILNDVCRIIRELCAVGHLIGATLEPKCSPLTKVNGERKAHVTFPGVCVLVAPSPAKTAPAVTMDQRNNGDDKLQHSENIEKKLSVIA